MTETGFTTTDKPTATNEAPKLYRPVELISADVTFKILDACRRYERAHNVKVTPEQVAEDLARNLLCSIGHEAHPEFVFRALAAIGAPASVDECARRLQAALEAGTRA